MSKWDKNRFQSSKRIKIFLGIITVLLIVLMFPAGESIESEVTVGTIWIHDDLIAPFSFPVLKDPEVYKKELEQAENKVYPIYEQNDISLKTAIDSIKYYDKKLIQVLDSSIQKNTFNRKEFTFISQNTFNTFKELRIQDKTQGRKAFTLEDVISLTEALVSIPYRNTIISHKPDPFNDSIALRVGNVDRIEPLSKFITYENAVNLIRRDVINRNFSPEVESAIIEYLTYFIYPHYSYKKNLFEEEIREERNKVEKTAGIVNENERIIAKHDRITKDTKLKIDSYKEAKGEEIGEEGILLQTLGKILHISFLLSLLVIYLHSFRKKIYYDNEKLLLISINIVFMAFLTFLATHMNVKMPVHILVFIPVASMILTIMFDSRVGFYSTVTIVLIAGAIRGNDYTFSAMNLIACALAVYTVRDIKNRNQIFRSFGFILLGYMVAIIAFGLERFAYFNTMLWESLFALTNSIVSPTLAYGLLIFFERIFQITTDLTLVELSNFDRPLLKELARKTPGTFNHSMTMATLAEAAAEKIGANPLLARVGAYYHDVGKIIMPQNFVENQIDNKNVHENLTPEESIELIKRHVQEGVEIAEQNKLPKEIVDFIPMHHGTMFIYFFLEKAKNLYGEDKVNPDHYRYPGPKPNTKETAIVMLADGCESAVRAIENPDAQKVENLINKIIKNRIEDKQLDESLLTFKDIAEIREVFLGILIGQHHRRIRYPQQDEMEKG